MEVGVIICNEPVKRYQVMACYVIDMVYLAMGPGTGGLPCMNLYFPTPGYLKDTLWVSAPISLGLCVFPHIFTVYACKLTLYIPNQS